MIKQNKGKLIISSIVTLLPIIVGLVLWNELPEQIATHWGADGNVDGWSNRFFAVFAMPIFMLIMHWFCIFITTLDAKNKNQTQKALGLIFWIGPVTSIFASAAIYATVLGWEFSMNIVTLFLLGLMFVVIGNYLPKCKQNYTLGIKVKWALENEENWNATHRFGGKMWVIGGLAMMVSVFLPENVAMVVMLVGMLILCVVPIVYSYLYYRKQCEEGTAVITPVSVTRKRVSLVIIIGIVLMMLLLFTGNIEYEFEEESFTINAFCWSDLTVEYDGIDSIEYREQDNPGDRTNGFGSAKLLMGSFKNDEFGFYTRYSYTQCDSCIVLEIGEKILVVNGKDEAETKQIYEELCQKLEIK